MSSSSSGGDAYSRVYNAANAAAQPFLGYLSGTTAASTPETAGHMSQGPDIARRSRAANPGAMGNPVASTSRMPASVEKENSEESRRKDSKNLDSIISVCLL